MGPDTFVHPSSIVEEGAELGSGVYVGPFCTISKNAKIGRGTRLLSHVVMDGHVRMGEDNVLHPFTVIGAPPQDLSYSGEETSVEIGHRNIFREGVSIHRGTAKDRACTTLGDDNYLMADCHVAHDCVVGNRIVMANQTALAGHVQVHDYAIIGGQSAVCQKARIGERTFIGAGSVIRKDLPPFMCAKEFAQISGPNLVGLKRQGVSEENVRVACELYKVLYLGKRRTEEALEEIRERFSNNEFGKLFLNFVAETKIGIQR